LVRYLVDSLVVLLLLLLLLLMLFCVGWFVGRLVGYLVGSLVVVTAEGKCQPQSCCFVSGTPSPTIAGNYTVGLLAKKKVPSGINNRHAMLLLACIVHLVSRKQL